MTAHVLSLCALQNALVALFGSSACCSALRVFCVLTMSSRKKKRPFELCPCEYPPTGLCLCQWHPSHAAGSLTMRVRDEVQEHRVRAREQRIKPFLRNEPI